MITIRMKICILAALTLYFALAGASWGRANERIAEFNIPAQALDSALIAFSKQADVQVSVSALAIAGMRSNGVVGRLAPSVALTKLLADTGLHFTAVGNRTFSVSQATSGGAGRGGPDSPGKDSTRTLSQGETPVSSIPSSVRTSAATPQDSTESRNGRPDFDDVQAEVIVTGTHIRGAGPIGVVVLSIGRAEIDKMGYGTVQEVVKSLPQIFGGGPSEDTGLGVEALQNAARSTGINLRGLGAGSTLVLVNGRRMAAAGAEGRFTDVSSIPLTAIERIEVLPDGASAIYGSDAVGGVVNFILRRDYDGQETRARFGSVTEGEMEEFQLGQTVGRTWHSGHAMVSYEYYKREALLMSAREQSANMDLRALGGTDRRDLQSNPGTIAIGANTWAIPTGQDGTGLTSASFTPGTANRENLNKDRDLLPLQERHSIVASGRQELGLFSAFADLLYTRRDALLQSAHTGQTLSVTSANPFYVNPTGGTGTVSVRYRFTDDLGRSRQDIDVDTISATLGVASQIASTWNVTLSGSYVREEVTQLQDIVHATALAAALLDTNPQTAFNPFGDGSFTNPATLEGLRARSSFGTDSDLVSTSLIADGALFTLAGGESRLALGAEYRDQEFSSVNLFPPSPRRSADFGRSISAAFAELRVPWVGAYNRRPGLERLALSVAGRYERYSDFGNAVTPRAGLEWAPLNRLTLRGSMSHSFKAPNLADLTEVNNNAAIFPMPDPLVGGSSPVLIWLGKNRELQEERARSWTMGADFKPLPRADLQIGLNYFETEFEDRIEQLALTFTLLQNPRFASLITRNPSAALRQDVCSRAPVLVGITLDQCLTAPVAALADVRVRNTAITRNRGIDLLARYDVDTAWGQFDFRLNTTYLLDFKQALLDADPLVELVDTVTNPLRLRARASLGWHRNAWGITLYGNHVGAYRDPASASNRDLDSFTTLDLQIGYEGRARAGWLDDVSLSLNVQNVFDTDPPFFDNSAGVGYDRENADLLGRFVSLQLRKGW